MEEKNIEEVKTWPKKNLVNDIQVFLGFANFYLKIIKRFSMIIAQLTIVIQTNSRSFITIIRSLDNVYYHKINSDERVFSESSKCVGITIVKNLTNF